MRSLNQKRIIKKIHKCRVNKKKKSRGSIETWNCCREIPLQNIEDFNEIIRIHRKQRNESKGSWKIMPKDSCEVYKERKKRQVDSEHSQNANERRSSEGEDDNVVSRKRKYKRLGNKGRQIDKRVKKIKQKGRSRKRRCRCRSCGSSHSTTSVCSSCKSFSHMDYE